MHGDPPADGIRIERATAADLLALRKRVLRDGRDEPPATNPLDDAAGTVHLAARSVADDRVVGCVTLVREARRFDDDEVGIQLVLMAVAPELRGSGVGALLLAEAQRVVAGTGNGIWAKARSTALGFYERSGFVAVGDEFIGALDLPHRIVRWG